MLHILCLKTCRIVQIYTLFMIGGPNFIPRNTTQLNKIDNYRAPSGLKTRTGNCWYWHLREPQEWPWCFMEQAPEPSWASFPLLCLWHHYLSVGRFRILDSKNWVGQPLLVRTARTTTSVICWAFWAIWRWLTSSHPPSTINSQSSQGGSLLIWWCFWFKQVHMEYRKYPCHCVNIVHMFR